MSATWDSEVARRLAAADEAGTRRRIRTLAGGSPLSELDGRPVVSFASNDYLGLSQHRAVIAAAKEATDRFGTGAGASRLVVGSRPVHGLLETRLASFRNTEAALVFPTGYAANLGVLSSFATGCRVVSDELNHASIIDGCRLAKAEVRTFRHRDLDEAESLLRTAPGRVVVVSDSVFSMDGDVAALGELSTLCARHGSLLVLDDAHVVLPVPATDPAARTLRVGTLSKTLGSIGGYVAGPAGYIDALVNFARPFIYTTALAPAAAAAALAALDVVEGEEGRRLVSRLISHVKRVRPGHPTPIIPVVLGAAEAALAASEELLSHGLYVPAIRPPTVPTGTSRLRVALSAAHTDAQVDMLRRALASIPEGVSCSR